MANEILSRLLMSSLDLLPLPWYLQGAKYLLLCMVRLENSNSGRAHLIFASENEYKEYLADDVRGTLAEEYNENILIKPYSPEERSMVEHIKETIQKFIRVALHMVKMDDMYQLYTL